MSNKRRALTRKPSWQRDRFVVQAPVEVSIAIDGSGDTSIYSFTHRRFGLLGRMCILPLPSTMQGVASVSVEIVESNPEQDAYWDEKYIAFKTAIDLSISNLPDAAPGQSPLPPVEDARKRRILYHRFLDASNETEMLELATSITREEYELLLGMGEAAQRTSAPAPNTTYLDPTDIKHHLDELQRCWNGLQCHPKVGMTEPEDDEEREIG
jgi:hypothetical protein